MTHKKLRRECSTSWGSLRREGIVRCGGGGELLLLVLLGVTALHGELLAPDAGIQSDAFIWRLKAKGGAQVESGVLGGSERRRQRL